MKNKLKMNIQMFATQVPITVPVGDTVAGNYIVKDGQIITVPEINAAAGNKTITYQQYFSLTFLDTFRASKEDFLMTSFAHTTESIPKGHGKIVHQRQGSMVTAINTLGELEIPPGQTIKIDTVEYSYAEYGNIIYFSRKTDREFIMNYKKRAVAELAMNALETLEEITRNAVIGGATIFSYPQGKTNIDSLAVGDIATPADVAVSALRMRTSKIKPHKKTGKYTMLVSSAHMEDLYSHPYIQQSLESKKAVHSAIGSNQLSVINIGNQAYYEYGKALVIPAGKQCLGLMGHDTLNVHTAILLGNEAFGTTGISGHQSPKFVTRPFESKGDLNDPFGKVSYDGWFVDTFGAGILYQEAVEIWFNVPRNHNLYYDITDYTMLNAIPKV